MRVLPYSARLRKCKGLHLSETNELRGIALSWQMSLPTHSVSELLLSSFTHASTGKACCD